MRVGSRVSPSVVLAAMLAAAALAPPALAQQDSVAQELQDIRNSVGLGPTTPPIDFTERPPLVVPPSYALPPPGRGDGRLGVTDTDAANRRRALIDPRRPVPPTDPGAGATGFAARTYLVDPPSGLRDPDAVAADITHDGGTAAAPARHARAHNRKKKTAAAQ